MMVMFIYYLILRSRGAVPVFLVSARTWLPQSPQQLWLTGVLASEPFALPGTLLLHHLFAASMALCTEALRHG